MPSPGSWLGLVGRRDECDALLDLLAAARAGRSQVLVLRGGPGIGKTALLDLLVDRAAGCRVARASGVESERELAHAGLHQLCAPFLDRLAALPPPQQQALGTAFGLRPGPAPDRFLVGLAVLGLLSEVAGDRPLVCVVDDAQWLDPASVQALGFVARRLAADPVAVAVAARDDAAAPLFPGMQSRTLPGLRNADAALLLEAAVTGALDPRVRDRIVAESRGNPRTLLELPRALTAAELAFGGGGDGAPPDHRREPGSGRRLQALPAPSRQLLLLAAAEPVGDVPLLWRAAGRLGLGPDAVTAAVAAAEAAGLVELRDRVRFRHPLVRSTVYRSAAPADRRAVHRALADATDADLDPDRRAWHRAHAAVGPDESVAAELAHSAGPALSSGGLAAAAALLGRSAALTPDPARRARRSLDAAGACIAAGAFGDASDALAAARVGPLGEADRARLELLCARLSAAEDRGTEALPLLLAAARRLEPVDADLARDAYRDALTMALPAGRSAARQVATAVRAAPPPSSPRSRDALLDGLAVLCTDGYAPAVAPVRRAVAAITAEDPGLDEALGSGRLAAAAAVSLWDDGAWDLLTRRHLQLAREAGALGVLPTALDARAVVHLFTGDLAAAASLVQECRWTTDVTGRGPLRHGEVGLLAVRGRVEEAGPVVRRCLDDAAARGEGAGVTVAQWARAVLCNGLGRYAEALHAAQQAAADPLELGPSAWALAELVEAGVRSGETAVAAAALDRLAALARAGGSDWALGVAASRAALLRGGTAADELHREAVDRLGRTGVRVELARAQLLHGEWLRREGRRVEARAQLRAAHRALSEMGLEAFADRARHELLATGETVRKRTAGAPAALTAQEAHIASLAAQGLTNPEIGAALYVSPRTVEWHLRKTFTKLGVSTRRELRTSLPARDHHVLGR